MIKADSCTARCQRGGSGGVAEVWYGGAVRVVLALAAAAAMGTGARGGARPSWTDMAKFLELPTTG